MGDKSIIFGSIIFLIIFVCLSANALWCLSSLSVFIGGLFISGIIPLVGQLNSGVARLGSPGSSGVVLICISDLVS